MVDGNEVLQEGLDVNHAVSRNIRPFLIAWFIFLLVVELIGSGIQRHGGANDFTSFYAAGYQLRSHPSQMYDLTRQEQAQHAVAERGFIAFYHPSYETLLFALFSFLNYRSAYLSFIAFSMLLMLAAFFAVRPSLSAITPVWQSRWSVLLFLFVPLLVAFAQGQDSMLSLLLYCLAWRQLESEKDLSAGCLVALALFKFQLALPIAALIAIRRGWRFTVGFMIACAGLLLLSFCIVGQAGAADYIRLLSGAASTVNKSVLAQKLSLDPRAMPTIAGLVYACGGRFLPSSLVFNMIIALCSLALFAWCARAVRQVELKTAFAIAVLCGGLLSHHFCFYDLTLLLLPIALLAGRMNRYLLAALFVVPAVVLLGFGINWAFLAAVPVLAALIHTIVFSRKTAKPLVQALAA